VVSILFCGAAVLDGASAGCMTDEDGEFMGRAVAINLQQATFPRGAGDVAAVGPAYEDEFLQYGSFLSRFPSLHHAGGGGIIVVSEDSCTSVSFWPMSSAVVRFQTGSITQRRDR